ncbi:MAG: ABC transporter permease [Bacillota bacterium]
MTEADSASTGCEDEEENLTRKGFLLQLLAYPRAYVGLLMTVLFVICALFAPYLTAVDPISQDMTNRLQPPGTPGSFLGTDEYGRDVLTRIVWGSRVSLRVGLGVSALTGIFGTLFGLIAGFYRRLDGVIMRIMDALMAFPAILLALAIVAALGAHEINAVMALAIVYVPRTARIVRSSVLNVANRTFIEAAKSAGAGNWRLIVRHVLPNAAAPLIVQLTFVFAMAILGEAALSFLGAGVPPPTPSWGNMMSEARVLMRQAPWLSLLPGAAVVTMVVGVNLFGDGLRDLLDPSIIS